MSASFPWVYFSAADRTFACASQDVIEIIRADKIRKGFDAPPDVLGWVYVEGRFVPVIDLLHLCFDKKHAYPYHEILVFKSGEQIMSCAVQKILAVSEVDKNITPPLVHYLSEKPIAPRYH